VCTRTIKSVDIEVEVIIDRVSARTADDSKHFRLLLGELDGNHLLAGLFDCHAID
jgi:hypothetical protein